MGLPRAYIAGCELGRAIIEMIHLMYQKKTAAHFLRALKKQIDDEMKRRQIGED